MEDFIFFIETQQYELSKMLTDQNRIIFTLKRDDISIFQLELKINFFSDNEDVKIYYTRCIFPFINDYEALGFALAYLKKNCKP